MRTTQVKANQDDEAGARATSVEQARIIVTIYLPRVVSGTARGTNYCLCGQGVSASMPNAGN
jgi:hypothetical protein